MRWVLHRKDRRRRFESLDQAKLFAAGLVQDRKEDLKVMPTRLTAKQLGEAEAASLMIEGLGMSLLDVAKWMLANYKKPSPVMWTADTHNLTKTFVKWCSNQVKPSSGIEKARPELGHRDAYLGIVTTRSSVSPHWVLAAQSVARCTKTFQESLH